MTRRFSGLTMSLVGSGLLGLSLLALPVSAAAQSTQPQPPAAAQQPPSNQTPQAQQPPATQTPPTAQPPAAQPPAPQQPPAAQPPATMPPQTATGTGDATEVMKPASGAIMLLDRISELIDRSLGSKEAMARDKANEKEDQVARPTGTSGTIKVGKGKAGQVSVDRAVLDEIKAEVEQLKTMISDKKQ